MRISNIPLGRQGRDVLEAYSEVGGEVGGRAIRGRPAAFAVQRRGGRARPRSRRPSAARSRATVTFSKRLLSADAGLFWKRADCAPPRSARKDTFRRLTFSFLSPVCPSPAPAISLARGHGPGDAPGCVAGRRRLGRGRSKGACFPRALTGRARRCLLFWVGDVRKSVDSGSTSRFLPQWETVVLAQFSPSCSFSIKHNFTA